MFQKITQEQPVFDPKIECSLEFKSFVNLLLEKNPKLRLSTFKEVREHPWFKGVDFEDLLFQSILNGKQVRQNTGEKNKVKGLAEKEDPRFTMAEYKDLEMIQNYEFEFRDMGFSRETDAIDLEQENDVYPEIRKAQSETLLFENKMDE